MNRTIQRTLMWLYQVHSDYNSPACKAGSAQQEQAAKDTDTDVLSVQRYEQTLHSTPWVYAQGFVITTLSMHSGAIGLCQVYSDYHSPACKAASAHWEHAAKDW